MGQVCCKSADAPVDAQDVGTRHVAGKGAQLAAAGAPAQEARKSRDARKQPTFEDDEDEDEDDGNAQEEDLSSWSYESLLETAKSLLSSAARYLLPEEAEEYNKEEVERVQRMNTVELREHVADSKRLQQGIDKAVASEDAAEELATAQRSSLRVAAGELKFDGDVFVSLLLSSVDWESKLVNADKFLEASASVPVLLGGLGRSFDLVTSDLIKKLRIAGERMKETADDMGVAVDEVTLQDMVERDVRLGCTHAGKRAAPASRTILRLMWFLDFIGALLKELAASPNDSLKTVCSKVYEETLAPRHAWILRKAARSGMRMLPNKSVFRKRLGTEGLSQTEEGEKLEAWGDEVLRVAALMWEYMKGMNLEELP